MTNSKQFKSRGLLSFALLLTAACMGHAATLETSKPTAAYATDQPATTTPRAEEVAREVLRLQQELGGSIVTDFSPPEHPKTNTSPPQSTAVHALRETAWRLDQSAYLLESLDLYSQADALRATATSLRLDARKMKSEPKSQESATKKTNSTR